MEQTVNTNEGEISSMDEIYVNASGHVDEIGTCINDRSAITPLNSADFYGCRVAVLLLPKKPCRTKFPTLKKVTHGMKSNLRLNSYPIATMLTILLSCLTAAQAQPSIPQSPPETNLTVPVAESLPETVPEIISAPEIEVVSEPVLDQPLELQPMSERDDRPGFTARPTGLELTDMPSPLEFLVTTQEPIVDGVNFTKPPELVPDEILDEIPDEIPDDILDEVDPVTLPPVITNKPTMVLETKPPILPPPTIVTVTTLPTTPQPTNYPSISPTSLPSDLPSNTPSLLPSFAPTASVHPSAGPTISAPPSGSPSVGPSSVPSDIPTELPSDLPSQYPTFFPTFSEARDITRSFSQDFILANKVRFNQTEQIEICELFASYTAEFSSIAAAHPNLVNTSCVITSQNPFEVQIPTQMPETPAPTPAITISEPPTYEPNSTEFPPLQLNSTIAPGISELNSTVNLPDTNAPKALIPTESTPGNRGLRGHRKSSAKKGGRGYRRGLQVVETSVPPTGQPVQSAFGQTTFLQEPTSAPSLQLSDEPTIFPSLQPTITPLPTVSQGPSSVSLGPSMLPTLSHLPSLQPSFHHTSTQPSLQPTMQPSAAPVLKWTRNNVWYEMTYRSNSIDVSAYPESFRTYVNSNLPDVEEDLRDLGLPIVEVRITSIRVVETPRPTISRPPSVSPSIQPSNTHSPTSEPTASPTNIPTVQPTESPVISLPPSPPSLFPSEPSSSENQVLVIVIVIVAVAIILVALFIFYRRRKWLQEMEFQQTAAAAANAQTPEVDPGPAGAESWKATEAKRTQALKVHTRDSYGNRDRYSPGPPGSAAVEGMISPSESLVSNQSLISAPLSVGDDSADEPDTTSHLQDEFDQYKDKNLEKMRLDVESNLNGFDGMMSQALTKALIDDDDVPVDENELLWGGPDQQTGAEIEASALSEVMDWLKRNESASVEVKRGFMQDMLNKMVSSVRHGVLGPEDASRAIHECAALLNLQLLSDLPVTTVIVYGLRKNVIASDVVEAFREFGDIEEAAVAPNQRGFGLVRFKTAKSVDRAMRKYRAEEIVVQDVAASIKVLRPSPR